MLPDSSKCNSVGNLVKDLNKGRSKAKDQGKFDYTFLMDLVLFQLYCIQERTAATSSKDVFPVKQAKDLEKEIMSLVKKMRLDLFGIDKKSLTALGIVLNDYHITLNNEYSVLNDHLAESIAYYCKEILLGKGNIKEGDLEYKEVLKFLKEKSGEYEKYVQLKVDSNAMHAIYQDIEEALKDIRLGKMSEQEKISRVEGSLRLAGEMLYDKVGDYFVSDSTQKMLKRLTGMVETVSLSDIRDVITHTQFSALLNQKDVDGIIKDFLPIFRACLQTK